MDFPPGIFARYVDLQRYVGWQPADAERIKQAGQVLAPHVQALVDDFYAEIERHPVSLQVITGGPTQIDRLKRTLCNWLSELFVGPYDEQYVARRWKVGLRHVEIGLPQVYAAAALSRLRSGMVSILRAHGQSDPEDLLHCIQSLSKLLDLDLAIIGDAYETEYVERKQEAERRRVQEALHQEKELSARLLANAPAAVVIVDRSGRIVRYNAFLERLVEGRQADLQQQDWFELFVPSESRPGLREQMFEAVSTGDHSAASFSSSFEGRSTHRQIHWSCVPLRDAAGSPFALLAIGHDVTDLHDAQRRAIQAERLAAIGQMATGLAHESRNALQRIGASAEMLELEIGDRPQAQELVRRIQQSQSHLHRLLDEVRSYAAPAVLDRSALRISEVWREAWELLLPQRQRRQAILQEHIQIDDLVMDGDRFRLVQVLRNLLENSLAACSDPVEIQVTCESAEIGGSPAIRISVHDSGPGLNGEQRRRIFEPFYTTKPTGSGLGMAIAQRIVEAHGGTIAVGDNSASGAEIVIMLPR